MRPFSAMLLILAAAVQFLPAQKDRTEFDSSVPALEQFHKPISELWHTAWPSRDIGMMKELAPRIEAGFAALDSARLPATLHGKAKAWKQQLTSVGEAVRNYARALKTSDTANILDASEKLHHHFELLVRVVRPVLTELDRFHRFLYTLHHRDIISYDTAGIRLAADSLTMAMEHLDRAVLPKRLESKKESFIRARASLSESVEAFASSVRTGGTKEEIVKAERVMHDRYEALEAMFE